MISFNIWFEVLKRSFSSLVIKKGLFWVLYKVGRLQFHKRPGACDHCRFPLFKLLIFTYFMISLFVFIPACRMPCKSWASWRTRCSRCCSWWPPCWSSATSSSSRSLAPTAWTRAASKTKTVSGSAVGGGAHDPNPARVLQWLENDISW